MRDHIAKIALGISAIILAGCGTPKHTNTLLFVTSTKFALDASASPTGIPNVTVGYKREEGVWMPLLANQASGVPATCTASTPGCVFQGKEDADGGKTDTYSVLASFGATFGGGADTTTPASGAPSATAKATGGLAQFFATGIAAQKLAESGGANLVSVQPAAVAEARAKEAELKLETLLGPENYKKSLETGTMTSTLLDAKKHVILVSVSNNNVLDKTKWDALVDKSSLADSEKTKLKALDSYKAVSDRLSIDAGMSGSVINPLHTAIQ